MKFGNVNAESVAAEIDVFQIILVDISLEIGGIEFVRSTDFVCASIRPCESRVDVRIVAELCGKIQLCSGETVMVEADVEQYGSTFFGVVSESETYRMWF